jgi:hypothetical protein
VLETEKDLLALALNDLQIFRHAQQLLAQTLKIVLVLKKLRQIAVDLDPTGDRLKLGLFQDKLNGLIHNGRREFGSVGASSGSHDGRVKRGSNARV